jgi:glycosyltransferase involved in cell wall biosynthesis
VVPGGIGTGKNNIGVPVLEKIVKLLSEKYSITVFSLFKVNENYEAQGFELVSIHSIFFLLKFIRFLFHFQKQHQAKKFALIHGFWTLPSGLFAVVASKLFKCKSVVSVLGGDAVALPEIEYGELRRWLPEKLILWSLRNTDQVIALTKFLVKNLETHGLIRKVKIIPWGVDTTVFVFRKRIFNDEVKFLHIGNLSPVKDQETLIKTFAQILKLRKANLTLIGEGVMERKLKELAKALLVNDHITFLPPVSYSEIVAYYDRCDILLHTSLSEGQSEVVTEAMSCGMLVCGTAVGLLHDLPEACIIAPIKEPELLAEKILKTLDDKNEIESKVELARKWAHEHSLFWTVNRIAEEYESFEQQC